MTDLFDLYKACRLCPRQCGVDRTAGQKGVCGCTDQLRVSRAALHMWEEPCISGKEGSGAVFFSGCNLRCRFCQNQEISRGEAGVVITTERLAEIFLELQANGANNINLVTACHYLPHVITALRMAKEQGLRIPVLYNSSGYESPEMLKLLEGLVDVWLPDFKYSEGDLARNYSGAPDYPEAARAAIAEMYRQSGEIEFDERGMIQRGLVVRNLLLPGHVKNSKAVLRELYEEYGDQIFISIMSQYTPMPQVADDKLLSRRVTPREYERLVDYAVDLGVTNGFIQEREVAKDSFIPSFDGEGVLKK